MERQTHTIDATDKSLGRIATKISILLRGKEKPGFVPYLDNGDFVVVENLKSAKPMKEGKIHYWHTGYLGGIKSKKYKDWFASHPDEVLRKVVFGMLPKTKLRSNQIKRLKMNV